MIIIDVLVLYNVKLSVSSKCYVFRFIITLYVLYFYVDRTVIIHPSMSFGLKSTMPNYYYNSILCSLYMYVCCLCFICLCLVLRSVQCDYCMNMYIIQINNI